MNDVTTLQARHTMYSLLSRALIAEADIDLIHAIKANPPLLDMFLESKEWTPFLEEESQALCDSLLSSEFIDLFIIKLVPYESFYTREDQMVESGTNNPAAIFYKEYGFEADLEGSRTVSTDHIGTELEFMSHLLGYHLNAAQEGNEEYATQIAQIEKRFLTERLLPFALYFLPAIRDNAMLPFY